MIFNTADKSKSEKLLHVDCALSRKERERRNTLVAHNANNANRVNDIAVRLRH